MNRRIFLDWMGVGILASSLPAVVVACSNPQTKSATIDNELEANASAAKADDFRMVGIAVDLEKNGFIVNQNTAANPIMVFRHPETRELIALNPQCTHQLCNVAVDAETHLLVCPCHDSRFAFDGKVVKGPARQPLEVYQVKQEEYLILVKVS